MMDRAEDGGWRDEGRGREGGGENGGKAEYAQRRGCCYIYMSSDGKTLLGIMKAEESCMTMMSINGRELLEYEEESCTSNE